MDKDAIKVFVYGSLKRGGNVRGMQFFQDAIHIGQATTTAGIYDMLDLGAFPGVVFDGQHDITGEVYIVDENILAQLDAIEGYPDFYDRTEVETTEGKAFMYYLPADFAQEYPNHKDSQRIQATSKMLTWKL